MPIANLPTRLPYGNKAATKYFKRTNQFRRRPVHGTESDLEKVKIKGLGCF